MTVSAIQSVTRRRCWSLRSVTIVVFAWLVLQIGGIFRPGLLDDVDSIYIEIAREMLHRHDYVTPYVDGVRFFDKPPLMYWMAAASMRIFGVHDWAARVPLALCVLALLVSVYALGIRLFREISPRDHPDRGGFYAALAVATGIGPYLYTRFYIPDILLALWMTLAVHLFLIALDRLHAQGKQNSSPLLPCLGFAAVTALNVLTKGLIGLVFPVAFVLLYLAFTKQLRLLPRFYLLSGTAVFLAIAAPWHLLAALRNSAIALPPGLGLPATGGWAWFYLYNEHIARFLGRRIPHDYGQVPVPLFWLLTAIWIMPWAAFLPGALAKQTLILRHKIAATARQHEAALVLLLWTVLVLGFFTFSSRQEYYGLPALPALALMAAALLARADSVRDAAPLSDSSEAMAASRSALAWSFYFLTPVALALAAVCGYLSITAPHPAPGTDIASLLAENPQFYNLSLGHLFDLTEAAMGLFRGPLIAVTIGMVIAGPVSYLLRRTGRSYAANLTLAAAMVMTLLAAHTGLARFYPILGSKGLAEVVNHIQRTKPQPGDLILIDGELTTGSTLVFYTRQQVHLVNGRINGLWYGSFWPDTPPIFETESSLRQLWAGPRRIFLFTFRPKMRTAELSSLAPVRTLASAGGKTVLINR